MVLNLRRFRKEIRSTWKVMKCDAGEGWRRCLLKYVIEGKIEGRVEVMGRRSTRHKQLLDDLKEKKGYSKLKEEAVGHTLCRTHFGRNYGLVIRQTTE
jgi:hypothetical protein